MQQDLDYPRPLVMVDLVLFTLVEGELSVLLTKRTTEPFSGRLALPGGFVHMDEDQSLEQSAMRVARTKLKFLPPYLEQLYTFSGLDRDPRDWSVSVAYYAVFPLPAKDTSLVATARSVKNLPPLPFDHDQQVAVAIERLRGKAAYSSLPAFLLGETFTLAELRRVYEAVMDTRIDAASFRTKILAQGIVRQVTGKKRGGAHRPAQLYQRSGDELKYLTRTI